MGKKRSPSSELSEHLAYVALQILVDNDGEMLLSDLLNAIEKREGEDIPEEQKERYDDGQIKWQARMKFAADFFVKAGYLKKEGGNWRLTSEGEKAVTEKEKAAVIAEGKKAKREHQKNKPVADMPMSSEILNENEYAGISDKDRIGIEDYENDAKTRIKEHIQSMSWDTFQDLCAALMKGMGYYIRNIDTPGPDGGIDIIAYNDPIGWSPPRIKIQVKRYATGQKVSSTEISQLMGRLSDSDMGVFITSSGFSRDCREAARNNNRHVDLIDFDRFLELWRQHYDKLSEPDKALLPLRPIYFLSK